MTKHVQDLLRHDPRNGLIYPACLAHNFISSSPMVNGKNFIKAEIDWILQNGGSYVDLDSCGILCNPTCSKALLRVQPGKDRIM